jgi:hypothetical protein
VKRREEKRREGKGREGKGREGSKRREGKGTLLGCQLVPFTLPSVAAVSSQFKSLLGSKLELLKFSGGFTSCSTKWDENGISRSFGKRT